MRRPVCPTCCEEGQGFPGTTRAGVLHYFRRVLFDLHQLRVHAAADAQRELEKYASAIISQMEEVYDRIFDDRRH